MNTYLLCDLIKKYLSIFCLPTDWRGMYWASSKDQVRGLEVLEIKNIVNFGWTFLLSNWLSAGLQPSYSLNSHKKNILQSVC